MSTRIDEAWASLLSPPAWPWRHRRGRHTHLRNDIRISNSARLMEGLAGHPSTSDLGDPLLGRLGPGEWNGVLIVVGDGVFDGFRNVAETARSIGRPVRTNSLTTSALRTDAEQMDTAPAFGCTGDGAVEPGMKPCRQARRLPCSE